MAEELRTFLDIQNGIIRRGKLNGSDDDVLADIKEKINTAQVELAKEKAYKWSGMTRSFILKAKYTTGTITATNGSQTVTGASTVWDTTTGINGHVRWKIKIGNHSTPFTVKRVASTTSLQIDQPFPGTTASGLSYIIYRDEYGLFPDCESVRWLYIPGAGSKYILPSDPSEVDRFRWKVPFAGGLPNMFTTNGQAYYAQRTWATFQIDTDFWEDNPVTTPPRNPNLIIYPAIFTTDRIAQIRYTRVPPPMVSDDEEPLLTYGWRRLLVLKPLMEWFSQGRDIQTTRIWEKEYSDLHKDMSGDIENTDSGLQLYMDRTWTRRRSIFRSTSIDETNTDD